METRSFNSRLEIRSADSGCELSGYVFQFGVPSDPGAYGKEAFSPALSINYAPSVYLLRDHDKTKVLARRGKNLEIKADQTGLFFSVNKLPDTQLARETRALVQAEILQGVSFGFCNERATEDGGIKTIHEFELHEISILPFPYHKSGKVFARSKEPPLYPPELC